jgi:chromate transporter
MTLLWLFIRLTGISLLAFGGAQSMLPDMFRIVVHTEHWMDAQTFADYFAIAQSSPGPNMLIVTLVGWHVSGLAGAMVATVAACGPSSVLALIAYKRLYVHPDLRIRQWVRLTSTPISVGLVAASSTQIAILLTQSATMLALTLLTVCITLLRKDVHPLWLIAGGAALGAGGWV